MKDLHSALKTEVVETHQHRGGVSYVLVRLQHGKTDVTYSLHAAPSVSLSSGMQASGVLAHLGFRVSDCSFVAGRKCLAREVKDGFDIKAFAQGFDRCHNTLRDADKDFQQCGIYLVKDEGPDFLRMGISKDGHTSPSVKRLKQSEDEVFRYVFTWVEGGRDKGWTIHYRPQHLPLSGELEAALEFLERFKTFRECPEFDFELCYWWFIPFEERPGTFERSNANFAHRSFDAHVQHFSPGIEKLVTAHAQVIPYEMRVLPLPKVAPMDIGEKHVRQEKERVGAPSYKYDVALSFAGTERELAENLAKFLRENGVKVFYDRFYPEHLWGKDLAVEFDKIYRKESRYCVIFVSLEYASRMWTIHERRSALARFVKERGNEYILPIKVDDVDLGGLPPTIGYLNLSSYSIQKICDILLGKLGIKD